MECKTHVVDGKVRSFFLWIYNYKDLQNKEVYFVFLKPKAISRINDRFMRCYLKATCILLFSKDIEMKESCNEFTETK